MKKSLLLYITITAVLLTIFTYMYLSQELKQEQVKYKNLTKKLDETINKLEDANHFSLEYDQKAQDYFNSDNTPNPIDYEKLIPAVTNELLSYNDDPKGNKFVGYDKIGEMKFVINKMKILNQRWIIADFSNGTTWGEVLLKYFVADNNTISFEINQTILYTN
jgi:hypothetical protein